MADEAILLKIKALVDGATSVDDLARKLDGLRGESARPIQDPTVPLKEGADQTALSLDDLSVALKAVVGAAIAKDFVDTAAQFESLEKTLRVLYGSSDQAAAEMEYLTDIAMRMGVPIMDVTNEFVKLTAATRGTAMEGQNTKAIFEAVANAMGMLGASSDKTQSAFMAIGQMASKNTVSMEELRLQLGEALPGAMQLAARAMGVTVAELGEMVARGEVLAADLLPKLAVEINKTFGAEPPDTTRQAIINLDNKLRQAYKTFGETGSMEAFKEVLKAVGEVLEAVTITASGAWEAFELLGKGFGAWFAAIQQALSGDLIGAFNGFKANMAEAMDAAATDINRVRDAVTETGAAVQRTQPIIGQTADAATRLAEQLKGVGTAGTTSANEIAQAFAALDLTTPAGVTAMVDAFTLLGDKTREADLALAAYLAKMSAADLSAFRQQIETLYQGGQIEAARFAQLNDQVLAASFAQLGLTAETALGRIGPAAGNAIASLDGIRAAIANTADSGEAKMQALAQAVGAALGKADTLAAAEALRGRIEAMGRSGELSAQQIEHLNAQLEAQKVKIEQSIPGVQGLEEAYRTLGVTTGASLRKAADEATQAFEVMRSSGQATASEIDHGFTAMAEAQLKAAAAVGQWEVQHTASMLAGKASTDAQRQAVETLRSRLMGLGETKIVIQPPDMAPFEGALAAAEEEFVAWNDRIAGATTQLDLSHLRDGLRTAWEQGRISAEQYMQALENIDTKQKDIEEGARRITLQHDQDALALADAAEAQDALFDAFMDYQKQFFFNSMPGWGKTLDAFYEGVYANINKQKEALDAVNATVEEGTNLAQLAGMSAADAAQYAEHAFYMLNDSLKNGFIQTVDQARQKFNAMTEDARGVLASLQDELDQMNGNLDEIEQRRAQQKVADIQAKIDEAQAAGNKQAVSDLQKALALQEQINEARIQEAKLREDEARQAEAERKRVEAASKTTPATPGETPPTASAAAQAVTPIKTVNVRLTLPDGRSTTVQTVAGSEDALLDALETLGYRS